MSRSINVQAWSILREDEKVALGLQKTMGKSSWQAGEIMGKSHYKYLEIKYRAEKFLVMFTEHFSIYDHIVEPYIKGNELVKRFFEICITSRKKPHEAIDQINESSSVKVTRSEMNQLIIKDMEFWGREESKESHPGEFILFNLIKDFDRWNNFRILPPSLQEPSAFKRRIKNSLKRQVRLTTNLPTLSIEKIIEQCKEKGKKAGLWLPLIDTSEDVKYLIKIKDNNRTKELINSIGIYIFKDKVLASQYLAALFDYVSKEDRDCKDGLDFWPKYREFVKKAVNYTDIQNINPSRKYLDIALSKHKFI